MAAGRTLSRFALAIVALNVVATIVAIAINLPSQFGQVGTDAGSEFLASGTAISAPLLPVVLLLVVAALAPRRDRWGWLGVGAGYLTAVVVATGAIGEIAAEPTEDTSRGVLIGAGVVWLAIALALVVLTTAAVRARRSATPTR